jgi:hypothetical protein
LASTASIRTGWAVEPHDLVAPEHEAQQMIETSKVIHVPVRDKDVADAQELARWQDRDVAEVEQQRPALELEVYTDARVPERIVDEVGIEA